MHLSGVFVVDPTIVTDETDKLLLTTARLSSRLELCNDVGMKATVLEIRIRAEGGPTSTPTVDGDAVFTLSRQGDQFCFDAATGLLRRSIIWC